MRRLALRVRLTLAFAAVVAIVLSATGVVVYRVFSADLNASIDRGLVSRSEEVGVFINQAGANLKASLNRVSNEEDDFAQVLSSAGRVLASTPQVSGQTLLGGAALQRAARTGTFAEHAPVEQLDGALRLRAEPVSTRRGRLIVVAGTTLGTRDESLQTLVEVLTLGGAAALILASLAGYAVAAGALRPVDRMRQRAETISPTDSDERLPVPPSGDEIARLGTTLNEMLDRVAAAVGRERAFVADASHELRTPLAILKAEIELALRHPRSAGEMREALESAAEETDRVVSLAEDLLVIARLDQGRLAIRADPIDPRELLADAATRFQASARRAGLTLSVDVTSASTVVGDRLRLDQALDNMIDNALRHAAREVRLSVRLRGTVVELHVADDGLGFEPSFIDRAFERFSHGTGNDARAGTGLGLAIVAAIASSHGGHVRAANLPGGGADVWLELPAAPACQSAPTAVTAS